MIQPMKFQEKYQLFLEVTNIIRLMDFLIKM